MDENGKLSEPKELTQREDDSSIIGFSRPTVEMFEEASDILMHEGLKQLAKIITNEEKTTLYITEDIQTEVDKVPAKEKIQAMNTAVKFASYLDTRKQNAEKGKKREVVISDEMRIIQEDSDE